MSAEKISFNDLVALRANRLIESEMSVLYGGFDPGTCGYLHPSGHRDCNISKDDALDLLAAYGGNWCCDSCGSSTYCAGAGASGGETGGGN